MSQFSELLPITAIVALVIFAAKETLEYVRRWRGDQRRLVALKTLLARECELNLWSVKSLRRIASEINTSERPNPGVVVTIQKTPGGRPYARVLTDDKQVGAHYPIPLVHRDLMSKLLLDVATLDKPLFQVMEPAYDALAELDHVRESTLAAPNAPEELGQDSYLEGLAGYALDQIKEAEDALGALYRHCTGNELTNHRLR